MEERHIKILFITGASRSGSTMLDRILGQIEGFFSLGEMHHIWQRSFIENQLCGCGVPFKECEFWQSVINRAFGGFDEVDPEKILKLRYSVQRIRFIPWLGCPKLRSLRYQRRLSEYGEIWKQLYTAIREVSGSNVLIDSSKSPVHGFILNTIPGIDLYVVHLVRDSRAIAYSWQRAKRRPEIHWKEVYMHRMGVWGSVQDVFMSNFLARLLGSIVSHYIVIRYEDLVAQPQSVLLQLFEHLGMEVPDLSHLFDDLVINLETSHMVSGNPMRFEHGNVRIRVDDEWKQRLSTCKRIAVTTLSWPYLLHYGYLRGK